ncbi:MAG TPA: ABC transporter ATP-binding protein [Phototrophicaceae bacterium]|nr:ABC transporter ATP-binding protein [Phototrophicaceae bacterium]
MTSLPLSPPSPLQAGRAAQANPILRLQEINTYYGVIHILQNVSLDVYPGELVCLLGGNASGKSTTLKTILGIVRPASGVVQFVGKEVQHAPTSYRVEHGMAVIPENRRIFGEMSVQENLQMGAYLRRDVDGIHEDFERMMTLFPRLKERLHQRGGTLSGGEQQMLAMARALMSRPKLLLMDEPSMGLAPRLVEQNFEIIQQVNQQGVTIFMVEQNANMALSIATRGYVVQTGRIVLTDSAANLLNNEQLRKAYLGR